MKMLDIHKKFRNLSFIGTLQTIVEMYEEAMQEPEFDKLDNDVKAAVEHAHTMAFRACSWAMQDMEKKRTAK